MKRTLTLAALIAVGAAAFSPLPSMAQTRFNVVIGAPPAPVYERIPAPRHGYVWSQGHWEWNGHRHFWVPGVWIVERPGYVYSAPTWYQNNGGWYMRQGGWAPGGRDRDRDGIADRYEYRGYGERDHYRGGRHDRDHDGVPNRYDRDRDGDGVPNRHDRAPDNRYRN